MSKRKGSVQKEKDVCGIMSVYLRPTKAAIRKQDREEAKNELVRTVEEMYFNGHQQMPFPENSR